MKTKAPKFTHAAKWNLARECIAEISLLPIAETFLPLGGAYAQAAKRILAGRVSSVFAKGNDKLPFYAFSSCPGHDCPQAGVCLYGESGVLMGGFCYSFKSWQYVAAYVRQVSNSVLLRSKEGRSQIAEAWMALPFGSVVRLYVDGDFATADILDFWMRLCHARPDLEVYGYSKSWKLLLGFKGKWPSNYLFNVSSGGNGSEAEKGAVTALPIARGEFLGIETRGNHGKAYQSHRLAGWKAYAQEVKANHGNARAFVCKGRCGDCLPNGKHACGSVAFKGVPILIGIH